MFRKTGIKYFIQSKIKRNFSHKFQNYYFQSLHKLLNSKVTYHYNKIFGQQISTGTYPWNSLLKVDNSRVWFNLEVAPRVFCQGVYDSSILSFILVQGFHSKHSASLCCGRLTDWGGVGGRIKDRRVVIHITYSHPESTVCVQRLRLTLECRCNCDNIKNCHWHFLYNINMCGVVQSHFLNKPHNSVEPWNNMHRSTSWSNYIWTSL